jgi:uncharacterized protein YggE
MNAKLNTVILAVLAGALLPWSSLPREASQPAGTISVAGEAEVRVVPDEAILTLGIETWHHDLSTAKRRSDQRTAQIIDVARKYGLPEKYIKTDHISIEPRYRDSYYREDLEGYLVRKSIVLTVRDLETFDDLLTDAIDAGANVVLGIQFRTTELRKHRDRARELAIGAAREKAEDLAQVLDRGLGNPQSIQEEHVGWWSWYGAGWWGSHWNSASQNIVQNISGDSLPTDGSIAPGQITISAQVRVTFQLQ